MTRIYSFVEKSGGKYILLDFFLNLTLYDFKDWILNNLILELFIHCVSIPRQHVGFNLGKRRLCVTVRIGWIKVGFWRSYLDAHFFIWDKKDVVYTVRKGLIKDGFWQSNFWVF